MLALFKGFLATEDANVDSIHVCVGLGFIIFLGLAIYAALIDWHSWNALAFSGGVAAHAGAIGAGRRMRDGPQQPSGNPQ